MITTDNFTVYNYPYSEYPELSGIYIIISYTNTILYVGQTENLKERHSSHERENDFKKHGAKYLSFYQAPKKDLDKLEKKYISQYHPLLNDKLN